MKLLITLVLFTPLFCFCQFEISGTIRSNDESLSFASLEVYNASNSKLITYSVSDRQGAYRLSIGEGSYTFVVNHIGYFKLKQDITIDANQVLDFELKENPTLINEITVQSNALDAKVTNDTTEYNLDKLLNGSEENLSDVLKKLPGIQIDANGKINADGKRIDKLLIDGKDFFGDQHQLATENISSEMIEGVSKYENYRDNYELDDSQPTEKTALNIEIDGKFKGKIKGNVSAEGGLNNRYAMASNIFSFSDKMNVFCIANTNNLGNQVFSIEDYISFQGGVSKLIESSEFVNSTLKVPSFLFSENKNKEKEEQLVGLNISYTPSEKLKLNTYTIFDRVNNVEQAIIDQHFFNGQQNHIFKTKDNTFLINNSLLELVYKINDKSILKLSSSISYDKHKAVKNDNFNDLSFIENTDNENLVFSNNLEYSSLLGEKSRFSSSLFHTNNSDENSHEINSSQAFLDLFINAPYSLLQDKNQTKNTTALYNGISTKLYKSTHLKFNHQLHLLKDKFLSSISSNDFNNDITIEHLENLIGIGLYNKEGDKFKYDIGVKYNLVERNESPIHTNILPYSRLRYNFNSSTQLSLLYHQSRHYPNAQQLIIAPVVSSYDYIVSGSSIGLNDASKNESIQFNCFINDLFSSTFFSLGAKYSRVKNVYSSDVSPNITYTSTKHIVLAENSNFSTYFFLEKKFDGIPLLFKTKNSYRHDDNIGLLNGERQPTYSTSLYTDFAISSNFKSPVFNFEIGYDFKKSETYNLSTSFTSSLETSTPFVQIFINYSNARLNINNSFSSYTLGTKKITNYSLNPSFKYHKPKSKWSFIATANDILNTSQNEIIENEVYLSHTEERTTSVMPGYLVVGFEYKF